MRSPRLLPPALRGRPFTVAEALELGVDRDRLRGADLRAPHRGVRVPVSLPLTLELRARTALLALPPGSALAGATAIELCDLPLPPVLAPDADPDAEPRPVEAAVPATSTTRPSGAGIDAHHADLSGKVHRLHGSGLPVVHPRHLWADLPVCVPFDDVVVLADAVRRRWADDASMAQGVASRWGRPGVVRARRVLLLVRYPVDSPMETRARLLFHRAGLPEPRCGREVSDGGWIAQPDLSWPEVMVAVEYDGDHHRTSRRQWANDIGRRRSLEARGWMVLVLTADDVLRRPEATVALVANALRSRGMTW